MKTEYTNLTIIEIMNLFKSLENKELPCKVAHALVRNMDIFDKEYQYYIKSLTNLIKRFDKYVKCDECGEKKYHPSGLPVIVAEQSPNFLKELGELLQLSVIIDVHTIDESALFYDDDKYHSLTVKEISMLRSLICEESPNLVDEKD